MSSTRNSASSSKAPLLVFLTGAGISKESGLDTFRCEGGIWQQHSLEDVATPEGFARDPDLVQAFYNARRAQLADPAIQPNAAHFALARLEKKWPGRVLLVTQNIDDLHERAGSQNVLHMHGELLKIRCEVCQTIFPWTEELHVSTPCPHCGYSEILRPHVVWFGEMPLEMERIYHALENCSLFVSIGTSGNVYPAVSAKRLSSIWNPARGPACLIGPSMAPRPPMSPHLWSRFWPETSSLTVDFAPLQPHIGSSLRP
jgi:NAD-dependent deacetylase